MDSSPPDSGFGKAAFRKPSNDVVNRKYRRKSPVDRSSSSEGSPNGARSSSPVYSKENPAKSFEDRRRKDDRRDIDRDYGRSHHSRTSDSHKHNDRHSSRSINQSRHSDYRHEKYVDEDERKYTRLSSRSGRESRSGTHSDYTSRDNEQNIRREGKHYTDKYPRSKTNSSGHRSRDRDGGTSPVEYQKNKDSSDRVGSGKRQTDSSTGVESGELDRHRGTKHDRDDKRDYQRIVGHRYSDLSPKLESKAYRHNSASGRDISEHQQRESSRAENKELESQEYSREEKKKRNLDYEVHKEKYSGVAAENSESRTTFTSEVQEKKPRLFSSDGSKDQRKNDEKGPLNPQKAQIGVTRDQDLLKDSDIDAAKVAAMKAAEQVNKNLVGTGYMTADQKKKLLWGNKKSTTVEEPTHRWDTTMFPDRERQEKFNKLMTLRLHWYLWPIVGCEGGAKGGTQTKTRQPRGKWCPPSREAESTTAGFGETIYCWAAPKGWPYSWTGSVDFYFEIFSALLNRSCTLLYNLEVLGIPTCEFVLDNFSIILETCDHKISVIVLNITYTFQLHYGDKMKVLRILFNCSMRCIWKAKTKTPKSRISVTIQFGV